MTTARPAQVTSADVALLRALARERSVVGASRRVGMSRDRAVYRLERLARAFGGPVIASVRGGSRYGGSELTVLGDRVLRGGFGSLELLGARPTVPLTTPNLVRGIYRSQPSPTVRVGPSLRLHVAFRAEDGASIAVLVDPEAIVVARRRFPSSARNVLAGSVEATRPGGGRLGRTLLVRTGPVRWRIAITDAALRQLGLGNGTRVWLYLKATAVRPVAPAGSSAPRRRGPLRS